VESATATRSLKVHLLGVADPDAVTFEVASAAVTDVSYYSNYPHAFGFEFTLQLPPGVGPGVQVLRIKARGWERMVEVEVRG